MFLYGCVSGKQIFNCLRTTLSFISPSKAYKALLLQQSLAVVSVDSSLYIVLALEIQCTKNGAYGILRKNKIYQAFSFPKRFFPVVFILH